MRVATQRSTPVVPVGTQVTNVVRFLDRTPDGKYDLGGRAVVDCPYCELVIEASGYMNAATNALHKHIALEHGLSVPLLPPATSGFIQTVGHVSEDPTVISHCPFCGSGGISGRSDGGADCDLCGRTFTVMEQPLYSNTPAAGGGASVPVTPFDPLTQETPFADGSAGAGEIPGQDQPGDTGGDEKPFGDDAASGGDAPPSSGDDSGGDDAEDKKPAFLSSLRAQNGTPLSSDDFVLHHAIRLARVS